MAFPLFLKVNIVASHTLKGKCRCDAVFGVRQGIREAEKAKAAPTKEEQPELQEESQRR